MGLGETDLCVFSSCLRSVMDSMRGFGAKPVDHTSMPK